MKKYINIYNKQMQDVTIIPFNFFVKGYVFKINIFQIKCQNNFQCIFKFK